MWNQIARLAEQEVRSAIGLRFEAFVDEAFQIMRWSGMVAVADYLARLYPNPWLRLLYWILATLLFGYIASRFLLRPEVRIFARGAPRWQRLVQSGVNFFLCVIVFSAVLWLIGAMTQTIADQRLAGR